MPNKYANKKGWKLSKQQHRVSNWSAYNAALKNRGDITVWLSSDAINSWYENDRVYDGTGAPRRYTDFSIITCHEIRQVYRLPLRQAEGFINSIFTLMGVPLSCPDYTTLSKRLAELNIKTPRYKKADVPDDGIHAIAIDSTGLKRYGRGEWHQEKYKLSSKASWRKLHLGVNQSHYIEACALTDRYDHDDSQVGGILAQVDEQIDHFSADGAYDETPIYEAISLHSPGVNIAIPPQANAILNKKAAAMRNRNIREIKAHGRMNWQRNQEYGRRNHAEGAMKRYQDILGDSLHARDFARQKQETMIGCGVLNKMTSLGMPVSSRVA